MDFFFIRSMVFLSIIGISSSMEMIDVRLNDNVTMLCQFPFAKTSFASNLSHPIILWYKDEREVIGVNNISNNPAKYRLQQIDRYTSQLILLHVQGDASGIYKCQTFTSEDEQRFQVNLIVPPAGLRLRAMSEELLADGRSTMFICSSEQGYPIPTYRWYKNDQLIEQSKGNRTSLTGYSSASVLKIKLKPDDHQAMLRCQVFNGGNEGETSVQMKLNISFRPIVLLFWNEQRLNETWTVYENKTDSLRCHVIANPPIISSIQWYRDGEVLSTERNNELNLNGLYDRAIHHISCQAKNSLGESETTVQLEFRYQPRLSMVDSLLTNEGQSPILRCSINAHPRCDQVMWFYQEKHLLTQPCPIYNGTHTFVEYHLTNVSRDQSGKYTCEVSNGEGGQSRLSTDVQIQYRPNIVNWSKKVALLENDDVILECRVDANPRAEIIWLGHTGEQLNAFAEEKLIKSHQISSELHLPSSHTILNGRYHCLAKNLFGQSNASLVLQSATFPDPIDDLQVMNITDQSFQLQWKAGFDGGSEQIFEILLQSNHTEERRETKFTQIWFRDLTENTDYHVFIRSKNRFGRNEQSKTFTVKTHRSAIDEEQWPIVDRSVYLPDRHQIRFRLKSSSIDDLCLQYYELQSMDPILECLPLKSLSTVDNEYQLNDLDPFNLRFQFCSIHRADRCSKSFSIVFEPAFQSSDWVWILIGSIIGLSLVILLLIICLCWEYRRRSYASTRSSMDTLKSTSDQLNSISIHVTDGYPSDPLQNLYLPPERSNFLLSSSPSIFTQSDSDIDGEYFVHRPIIVSNHERNVSWALRPEESTCSQSTDQSHHGKKLIYQVVV